MEPEIRYTTTTDGVSIAYYTMGEGHPLLVTSQRAHMAAEVRGAKSSGR
jgi:hypothetical protein